MNAIDLTDEAYWRVGVFVFAALVLLALEAKRPFRDGESARAHRLGNLLIGALGVITLRLAFPLLAVGLGAVIEVRGWGLMQWLDAPYLLALLVGVVALDLAVYWQHRLMHIVPWLWRLHRPHHTATEFELSLALRFHPLEQVLSLLVKMLVIAALGIPALAVLVFEIILSTSALYTHGNIALPERWDRRVRRLLVTPSMHRIHHSVRADEHQRNFGFFLSLWDRAFASYCANSREPPQRMPLGLPENRAEADQRALGALLNPFAAAPVPGRTQLED